jgi:hydrogenase maturation protease
MGSLSLLETLCEDQAWGSNRMVVQNDKVLRSRQSAESGIGEICIIGYGNPMRRDDGIGAFVAERLRSAADRRTRILAFHQLDPLALDEVQEADVLILVDATIEDLDNGIRWNKVRSRKPQFSHTTHHMKPSGFVALLEWLYHRTPETWVVSVKGEDFGHGAGLTEKARKRALRACEEIGEFLSGENPLTTKKHPYRQNKGE